MITKRQLFFVITQSQIGIGILSLPYLIHEKASSDGWISVLLAGVLVQLFILFIWLLWARFPNNSIFEITKYITGNFIGTIINIIYIVYSLLVSIMIVSQFNNILNKWILDTTPYWVLSILILSVGFYLSKENIKIIARFDSFVSVIVILVILTVILSYKYADIRYILPIGKAGFTNIIIGVNQSITAMVGFEILLIIFPLVEGEKKDVLKISLLSTMIVSILYGFITFSSYLVFSPKEIVLIPEPILYMLKAISLNLLERLDIIFISIWMIPITTSLVSYLYMASRGIGDVFYKGEHKYSFKYILIIIFFASFFLQDEDIIKTFSKFVSMFTYVTIVAIPIFLLFLALIFKKRQGDF